MSNANCPAARTHRASTLVPRTGLLGVLWLAVGCAFAGDPLSEVADQINLTLDRGKLALIPGDALSIQISMVPEWNHDVIVDNEGRANFLGLVEPLVVEGRSVEGLRTELESRYSSFLLNPKVGVFVRQYAPRQVVVMGEVIRPGAVTIEGGRLTLLEAIGKAGGHRKDSARLGHLLLVRWSQDQNSQIIWKVDARPSEWQLSGPLYMQPFDFVYIPNTPIDKANIFVDKYIKRMIPLPIPSGLVGAL